MDLDWQAPGRIRFGRGVAQECAAAARDLGGRVFLVTGSDPDRHGAVVSALETVGVAGRWQVACEPQIELVVAGAAAARQCGATVVVAVGGGAVLDGGKGIAALAANPGDPMEYLEVIGRGRALERPALPVVALPTTAGTGAEATRNAVLGSVAHRVKVSLRHPSLLPRVALVDPALTEGLPRGITASAGLDALTQLLEAFVCRRANVLTDGLCREGLDRVGRALRRVLASGGDREARTEMAWCSLASGLALGNAGLGAVHGFAGPIGGMFPLAHGVVCARLLPEVVMVNIRAMEQREPGNVALARFDEAARRLTGEPVADRVRLVSWLRELVCEAAVPTLASGGLVAGTWEDVVAAARRASSMRGNPVGLEPGELLEVLALESAAG